MAAQTVFSVEMFPVGVSMMDEGQTLNDVPRNTLPAPQLVMLANVAAVTLAAEGNGGGCDGSVADEKEMMELKTVGSNYSDSEDENIIRYSYDNQNHREVCFVEYPESPGPNIRTVVVGDDTEAEEEDEGDNTAEDLSRPSQPRRSAGPKTPQQPASKHKETPVTATENSKKKKPFHCKPCSFQAQNEQEFVEHLSTHAVSKMIVVNRVEGRSKGKTKEAESSKSQAASGEEVESSGEVAPGDSKGLIRCERCGYNTNRYDHYIAHLKHHSKEGDDHRVFKCTLCPYTTVSQYHWRKHLRNHFPSKLHTCDQCCYFSDRKSNYIQHIRTHTGIRPFQCPYCKYSSSQKTHLTRHMRTHSGERPFKCESCNYLAANQHEVTRHARQVHNGPKPLGCAYCEYKTADRSNFKKHVELHLKPRQFLCPLCKYAASKKCNLQYHIKSRHSGCDVAIDVSNVKLRVKKSSPESAEDNTSVSKFGSSSSVEDDVDMDDVEEDEESDSAESSPINLSVKKNSKSSNAQPVQSGTTDKAQKKTEATSEKEKLLKVKMKVEVEKKVTTRQKKTEKESETLSNSAAAQDSQTQMLTTAASVDSKLKRRVKKQPAEKVMLQDQAEITESVGKTQQESLDEDQMETEKHEQERSEEERAVRQKVEKQKEKMKPEKVKEQLKIESSTKENKSLNKPRRSGSKRSEKSTKQVEEAQQKVDNPEKTQKEKVVKAKAVKRKAGEALDLSRKSSSDTTRQAKRVRATAAEKLQLKPNISEDTKMTNESSPALQKDPKSNRTPPAPVKQKRTRNANKKTSSLQEAVVQAEDKTVNNNALTSHKISKSPPPEPQAATKQLSNTTQDTNSDQNPAEKNISQKDAPAGETTPTMPEKTPNKPITEKVDVSPSCSSGEKTPSATDHPPSAFAKPTSSPSLLLPSRRSKPGAELEDDEGIHSSHEGGSDISDSASEGSDDSGLNGNGAGSGKMANDPETPTDEIPTPTELKSHMCIFCDRTFPLEVQYRRHLNRHLVNVYYMDSTAKSQK